MPRPPEPEAVRHTFIEPPAGPTRPGQADRPAPASLAPPKHPAAVAGDTEVFRPTQRPPMAVLQVFDDGQKTAEPIRLRDCRFLIGRNEGNLVIPHDPLLSGKHAEIVRAAVGKRYAWHLRDLGSTNGSFVRAKMAVLRDGSEVMLARTRLRFVAAAANEEPVEESPADTDICRTYTWQTAKPSAPSAGKPYLLELLPTGEGRKFPLNEETQWIGRDRRQCGLALPDEPTINPRHARIFRDPQGRWQIEECGSLNGIWVRITEITLTSQSSFLLGEQMFAIAFP